MRYASGEEPRVGDRVRSDSSFCEPHEGTVARMAEGVPSFIDTEGDVRGWMAESTVLLARAPVTEADDNGGLGWIHFGTETACRVGGRCADDPGLVFALCEADDPTGYSGGEALASGAVRCSECERIHAERSKPEPVPAIVQKARAHEGGGGAHGPLPKLWLLRCCGRPVARLRLPR